MTKRSKISLSIFMCSLIFLVLLGCGGGGGNSKSSAKAPSIEVLPANFVFATETAANQDAPLEVKITNNGSADLLVSNIALQDTVNFALDVNGGTAPCLSTSPTLVVGDSCTVMVDFQPSADGQFDTTLSIASNDNLAPTMIVDLTGTRQFAVSELHVTINQIDACPRPQITAYVSVTDQAGFPVTSLGLNDFQVFEGVVSLGTPSDSHFVENTASLSVALVMDYSGSITNSPDSVDDMENAAAAFVAQLGVNDEAEIVKFADSVDVVQGFTSNKAALTAAINSATNLGTHTALYDAIVQAVDDAAALGTKVRKAVVLITDGKDDNGSGSQQSNSTLNEAITYATDRGVPVFTVGLGLLDVTILQQIADETGGTFSDSATSDNLFTIYQQLASLLITDQYILTYTSTLNDTNTGVLKIIASDSSNPGVTPGEDTANIKSCTP